MTAKVQQRAARRLLDLACKQLGICDADLRNPDRGRVYRSRANGAARRLVLKAHAMFLMPVDILTEPGQEAFQAIADAIVDGRFSGFARGSIPGVVGAEWSMVLSLIEADLDVVAHVSVAS